MQIEIDFEVFKALTALRQSEADSYNHVIRRLLDLPAGEPLTRLMGIGVNMPESRGLGRLARGASAGLLSGIDAAEIARVLGGALFNGVLLPEGTKFRATYKGNEHFAEIRNGQWVDSSGIVRTSPSDAASSISGTNVNGWKFWHVLRPGDTQWCRLEELKP